MEKARPVKTKQTNISKGRNAKTIGVLYNAWQMDLEQTLNKAPSLSGWGAVKKSRKAHKKLLFWAWGCLCVCSNSRLPILYYFINAAGRVNGFSQCKRIRVAGVSCSVVSVK